MITFKDLFGVEHTIKQCTLEDIDTHFAKVVDTIEEEDHSAFRHRMVQCVEEGTAYAITDDSCFLYYLNYKPCLASGAVLYGKESPTKLLCLICGIFDQIDKVTIKLDFHLHKQTYLNDYKSLLTPSSMMRQGLPDYPLIVRVDKLRARLRKIYETKGLV